MKILHFSFPLPFHPLSYENIKNRTSTPRHDLHFTNFGHFDSHLSICNIIHEMRESYRELFILLKGNLLCLGILKKEMKTRTRNYERFVFENLCPSLRV